MNNFKEQLKRAFDLREVEIQKVLEEIKKDPQLNPITSDDQETDNKPKNIRNFHIKYSSKTNQTITPENLKNMEDAFEKFAIIEPMDFCFIVGSDKEIRVIGCFSNTSKNMRYRAIFNFFPNINGFDKVFIQCLPRHKIIIYSINECKKNQLKVLSIPKWNY